MTAEKDAWDWIKIMLKNIGNDYDVRAIFLVFHRGLHGKDLGGTWRDFNHLSSVLNRLVDQEAINEIIEQHNDLPPHEL